MLVERIRSSQILYSLTIKNFILCHSNGENHLILKYKVPYLFFKMSTKLKENITEKEDTMMKMI